MGFYKRIDDLKANKMSLEQVGNFNQTVVIKNVITNDIWKQSIHCVTYFMHFQIVKGAEKGLEAVVDLKAKINSTLEKASDLYHCIERNNALKSMLFANIIQFLSIYQNTFLEIWISFVMLHNPTFQNNCSSLLINLGKKTFLELLILLILFMQ